MQHWCSHSNAICNQGFRNRKELRTHKDMQSAEHQGRNRQTLKTIKTSVPATASHTSCPSSPPAATLHGRTQGFVLRLPPQHKPHATLMQPSHCDLPQGIPQPQRTTHTRRHLPNTSPMQQSCSHSNAICNQGFHNRIELNTHRTRHAKTRKMQNTKGDIRRTKKTPKRACPQPPHTRAALHRRLQLLYMEKHKVSCSGFLPNTNPMQHSCSH